MNVLLVTAKKALTRRWLSEENSNLNTCVEITVDIYSIENISAFVRIGTIFLTVGKMG